MIAKFCPSCGGNLTDRMIPTEDRPRLICDACGFIVYQNPRIVVNTVTVESNCALIIKRGIEPRVGFWALPGGFLELQERAEDGAARETREETGIEVEIQELLGVFTRVEVGVVNIVYLAKPVGGKAIFTPEAPEHGYVAPSAIPWDDLAYQSHRWGLEAWLSKRPGT